MRYGVRVKSPSFPDSWLQPVTMKLAVLNMMDLACSSPEIERWQLMATLCDQLVWFQDNMNSRIMTC